MKTIALILIVGIIALACILPASAAGQGGNGKLCKTGTAPHDGTGCQNRECQHGQQGGNGTCINQNCPNNGVPPLDGTGLQYGKGRSA